MLEFEILAQGNFAPKAIRIVYDPVHNRIPYSPEIEGFLEKYWQRHRIWAEKYNLSPRNEDMLRLESFQIITGPVEMLLDLGLTNSREFAGTRSLEVALDRPRNELANPLGASAVIVTSDDKILCGKRPPESNLNPNRYFLLGGFLTPEDLKSELGLFGGILREIYEETGIPLHSHRLTKCVGLVYDSVNPHPELCFSTHVVQDFATVLQYSPSEKEVTNLEFIDNDGEAICDWMCSLHPRQVVGTAEACLLLHGLQCFGQSWFDNCRSRLTETL